jgi:hypothetical protein
MGDRRIAYRSTGLGARFRMIPKASIERPGASKALQSTSIGFRKFHFLSRNRGLSMAYGRTRPKNNCRSRPGADMGSRAAQANGSYARE